MFIRIASLFMDEKFTFLKEDTILQGTMRSEIIFYAILFCKLFHYGDEKIKSMKKSSRASER